MMESGDALWVGIEVIRASCLSKRTKKNYSYGWRIWASCCQEAGVAPMAATGDDALRWLGSGERNSNEVRDTRKAVNFVYQRLGIASPLRERRVMRALFGESGRYGTEEEYSEGVLASFGHRVRDYLIWCQRGGRAALPGSGAQVAEFLLSLSEEYSYTSVEQASAGVSRYLEDNGHPGTSHDPAVLAALPECKARFAARGGPGSRQLTGKTTDRRGSVQEQWREWCEGESVEWEQAGPADALRHLRGLEHQRTAASRVFMLSQLYEEVTDPFSSEAVLEWKRSHLRALKDGTLPEARRDAPGKEVVAMMRAARAMERTVVPVGLTLEELEAVDDDVGDRYAKRTLSSYATRWASFESWLAEREIPLEEVVGQHVVVFLKGQAQGRRVSTVRGTASALAMVFDELDFKDNPALGTEVDRYLMTLVRRRREAPSQMDPFREVHYQAIVASAGRALSCERAAGAELRGATDVAMFGLMFDGMLRGGETAQARWQDLSRFTDGSGSLLVPFSKTDQFGEGALTYVSRRSMESLGNLKEVRRSLGLVKPGDDRIFQLGPRELGLHVQGACKAAGIEGRFGTHSMRIGMAQELAVAGFGLVLIMLAGRWQSPGMPAYYIRGLKVSESAVAELHWMWADGRRRVEREMRGYDVLSMYHAVRYGT